MRGLRRFLRGARWPVVVVLAASGFEAVEGRHFTEAWAAQRQARGRLVELAAWLEVPVARLEGPRRGPLEALVEMLPGASSAKQRAQERRLKAAEERAAEEVARNPFRHQIEAVMAAHRGERLQAALRALTSAASRSRGGRGPAARRALLDAAREEIAGGFRLAALPEGLPAVAARRHREMQDRLLRLARRVRPIVEETRAASSRQSRDAVGRLDGALEGLLEIPPRRPETARPLPVERRVVRARRASGSAAGGGAPDRSSRLSAGTGGAPGRSAPAAVRAAEAATAVHPEVAALAAALGNSPARIFAWVHDTIRYDPKWGQTRSARGTLLEETGTSWDQAVLLQQLLAAAGVEARLEWGEVEIPMALLLQITGTVDPADAGSLLATGGVPVVLQSRDLSVSHARIGHVWVRAHVDYVPDRGVRLGVPDLWVRMDASLKRHLAQPGMAVYQQVPFALGDYLRSGTPLSPRRFYEEALWGHIRANGLACTSLAQLARSSTVIREEFPFLPGTLRGRILRIEGEAAAPPPELRHRLRLELAHDGETLLAWEEAAAAIWGRRLEIAWAGATEDDRRTLDAHGGIFATPPYLVDLRPEVRIDGVVVAAGEAVRGGREAEVRVTSIEASGVSTPVSHPTLAGEHHVVALDLGALPGRLLEERGESLRRAEAAGDAVESEAETLALLGARYLHDLGRDLGDLAGWSWHRLVRLGTEGLVSQTAIVTAAVGGQPLAWRAGPRSLDVARMTLGLVPADGDGSHTARLVRLLGAQGSHLEGEVFDRVLAREGIAAVSALTRAAREGQTLTRVCVANLETALAAADLGEEAEERIRRGVGQGLEAWVAEREVTVNRWTGTGYVLADPATGAAAHLISGGLAGGSETGDPGSELDEILGSEPWLEASPVGDFVRQVQGLLAAPGGPPRESRGPAAQQSDPVNLATGNFWLSVADLTVRARGLPVVWQRTYNSRSGYRGPLGHGWTFNYGERLEAAPGGALLYRESDGTEHRFEPDGEGGFRAPPGRRLELTADGAGFALTAASGVVSRFAGDGRLLSIADANGNTVELRYDPGGALEAVLDAAGRPALTVETDAGRIRRIVDLAGRSVHFAYSGDDLVEVTDVSGETWAYAYDADHNLVARTDPLGSTDLYAYDSSDRCIAHRDPLGHQEAFSYARVRRGAVLTDRLGQHRYFEFDERGRALLEADPLGNVSRSTWDDDNHRLSITDPRGGTTSRTFDEQGRLLSETGPLGGVTSVAYDADRDLSVALTDVLGHTVTYDYDAAGNLLATTELVGGEAVRRGVSYDLFGQPLELRDPNGNATTLVWDPADGTIESLTDALGQTTTVRSDLLGRVVEAVDPLGHAITMSWDEGDRLRAITDPFGKTTTFDYDAAGRRIRRADPGGVTVTAYDAAGRPVATTDALGGVRRTEYDAAGRVIARIDAAGGRTEIRRDALGRPLAMVDPLGAVWSFAYCAELGSGCTGGSCAPAAGAVDFCELTDPLGRTMRRDHDAAGRVTRSIDPLGNATETTYDAAGRRVAVRDPLGRLTRFEHDALDRLVAVVEPDGARTEHRYDANGNLLVTVDAEGREWLRTYDPLNRLLTASDPLGNTTVRTYDALGNLASLRNPDGELVTFDYEVRRLTAVRLPGGATETFGYDALGRRISAANAETVLQMSYDALDRLLEVVDGALGESVAYAYDPAGRLVSRSGPGGTTAYFYDAAGRLVEQQDPLAGVFRFAYDESGRRSRSLLPNGVVSDREYDAAGRLTGTVTRDATGAVLDGRVYELDAAGRRAAMRSLRDSEEERYRYDANGRLRRWERGPLEFEEYAYDRVGNRLSLADPRGTVRYAYDPANRLLSERRELPAGGSETATYVWDAAGRLLERHAGEGLSSYRWDPLGRLLAASGPSGGREYGYDALGRRVRESDGQATVRILHSFEDVIALFDESGSRTAYYAHGPGVDEPLAEVLAPDGGIRYFHRDGLGSITALSSTAGTLAGTRRYAPFGGLEDATGAASRYGFTGREPGPDGLLYFRARYLESASGRFVSADPFPGLPESPASQHRYAYAHNDPVNQTDPFGLAVPPFSVLLGVGILSTFAFYLSAFILLGLVHLLDVCVSDLACFDALVGAISDPTMLIPMYSLVALPMLLLIEGVLPPLAILLTIVSMYLGMLMIMFGRWLSGKFSGWVAGAILLGVNFGVNWAFNKFVQHAVASDEARQDRR